MLHTAGRWHCLWEDWRKEKRGKLKTSEVFAEYRLGWVSVDAASLVLTQACRVYDFHCLRRVTQSSHILHRDRQAKQSSPWDPSLWRFGGQACLNKKAHSRETRLKKQNKTKTITKELIKRIYSASNLVRSCLCDYMEIWLFPHPLPGISGWAETCLPVAQYTHSPW